MNIKNLQDSSTEDPAPDIKKETVKPPNSALLRAQKSRAQANERREELLRQELSKQYAIRQELSKQDVIRQELSKQDVIRQELSKQYAIRQELSKQESLNQEPSGQEELKQESIRIDFENQEKPETKDKPKGILKFDTNPPKVWEFDKYGEATDIKKGNTKNVVTKLRKRESDLNLKHR